MNWLVSFYDNKILFFGSIAAIIFVVIAIVLIKKALNENDEDTVEIEKIDGQNSVFDEILEDTKKTNNKQLDLDSMIAKMKRDIEAKASEVVEKFEQEQEEKSVISYSELIGGKEENTYTMDIDGDIDLDTEENVLDDAQLSSKLLAEIETEASKEKDVKVIENDAELPTEVDITKLEIDNNDTSLVDTINEETSSIIEASPVITKLNMKEEFVEAIKTGDYEETSPTKETGKFKATKFISPIYGVQNIKMQYPTVQNMKEFKTSQNYDKLELEQTLNMEKITKQIDKDEDFLNALKEFRKNLE